VRKKSYLAELAHEMNCWSFRALAAARFLKVAKSGAENTACFEAWDKAFKRAYVFGYRYAVQAEQKAGRQTL
jgi:hypothetical protein